MGYPITRETGKDFVNLIKDDSPKEAATLQVYATINSIDMSSGEPIYYVDFDGAEGQEPCPVSSTIAEGDKTLKQNDRVVVLLSNRQGTIIGNITSPMAGFDDSELRDDIDKRFSGEETYVYMHDGKTETVYKRADGTYYYISDDGQGESVEVDVLESQLVHDGSGKLVVNIIGGVEQTAESIYEDHIYPVIQDIETIKFDSQKNLEQINKDIYEKSLIALGRAEIIEDEQGLVLRGTMKEDASDLAFLKLTPVGAYIIYNEAVIAEMAGVAQTAGASLEGVMSAQKINASMIRFKSEASIYSEDKIGGYGFIAKENGHLALKAVN